MALIWGGVAAALGVALSGLLRRSPRALQAVRRWVRWLAATAVSLYALMFAAGAVGAMVAGDNNPKLPVMMLGTLAAAWLLWRGPQRHMGVGGHWLAGAWLVYSSVIGGRGLVAELFLAVALPALLTAGVELAGHGDAEQGPR